MIIDTLENSKTQLGKAGDFFPGLIWNPGKTLHSVGLTIGPTWSTHWFKLSYTMPQEWSNKTVHLLWDTGSEGAVWSKSGQILQGLSGDSGRTDFCLSNETASEVYVEVACNSLFGAGNGGMINPPDVNKTFTLKTAKLVVFREDVYQLLMDFEVLIGLCKYLPQDTPLRFADLCFLTSPTVV